MWHGKVPAGTENTWQVSLEDARKDSDMREMIPMLMIHIFMPGVNKG
jgi:hypothetical protein